MDADTLQRHIQMQAMAMAAAAAGSGAGQVTNRSLSFSHVEPEPPGKKRRLTVAEVLASQQQAGKGGSSGVSVPTTKDVEDRFAANGPPPWMGFPTQVGIRSDTFNTTTQYTYNYDTNMCLLYASCNLTSNVSRKMT